MDYYIQVFPRYLLISSTKNARSYGEVLPHMPRKARGIAVKMAEKRFAKLQNVKTNLRRTLPFLSKTYSQLSGGARSPTWSVLMADEISR
jgi:hypothetical protein